MSVRVVWGVVRKGRRQRRRQRVVWEMPGAAVIISVAAVMVVVVATEVLVEHSSVVWRRRGHGEGVRSQMVVRGIEIGSLRAAAAATASAAAEGAAAVASYPQLVSGQAVVDLRQAKRGSTPGDYEEAAGSACSGEDGGGGGGGGGGDGDGDFFAGTNELSPRKACTVNHIQCRLV